MTIEERLEIIVAGDKGWTDALPQPVRQSVFNMAVELGSHIKIDREALAKGLAIGPGRFAPLSDDGRKITETNLAQNCRELRRMLA